MAAPGPSVHTRAERARRILARLGIVTCLFGCTGSLPPTVKAPLQEVDAAIQTACEGMAQALALSSGADAQRIVAASCLVEGFTRGLRERLLSEQLNAAKAAGVAVPDVTSDHLEPSPYESQDAE